MKKNLLLGISAIAVAIGVSACTTNANVASSPLQVHMPLHLQTDVEVKPNAQRVEARSSIVSLFGVLPLNVFFGGLDMTEGVQYSEYVELSDFSLLGMLFPDDRAYARGSAMYKAVKESKADVILAPRYDTTRRHYILFSTTTCDISGIPGWIKDVKVVDEPSLKIIETQAK